MAQPGDTAMVFSPAPVGVNVDGGSHPCSDQVKMGRLYASKQWVAGAIRSGLKAASPPRDRETFILRGNIHEVRVAF
ncbi:hypothetical protein APED_15730 [Acanthopleuribacter pedis]